ncbi:MAG: 2-phospho-L-lactate guanylyltransferase [Chloroflexi bacterium]|nr:2-phospho-L-lactate guanylyltransferase [Chloroflexota bacterium]
MRTVTQIHLIVPMKPLATAKSRLAQAVGNARRRGLVLMLLQTVLRAAARASTPLRLTVAGGDADVEALCHAEGARWTPEKGHDLNSTLAHALKEAFDDGAAAVLVLPGDLPLLSPGDVDALVKASRQLGRVVLAPASRSDGTNALLVPASVALHPSFGEGSFQRHLLEVQRLGCPVALCRRRGLGFDLDGPEDLALCERQVSGFSKALSEWETRLRQATAPQKHPFTSTSSRGH